MTVAPYGSWTSRLTPDSFSKGNCASICEVQISQDSVFWVEQCCTTGERLLFSQTDSGDRIQWATGKSVRSFVHEYGGGSFLPNGEGGVVFSTAEGLFEQKSVLDEPILFVSSEGNILRFGDFSITPTHIFCVHESHTVSGEDPENSLVSIDRKSHKMEYIARGADFYAYPRVSPSGEYIVWMQWNHINMPWDETSIHLATLLKDGSISEVRELKSGVGKNINYYCPSWNAEKDELFVVHDATNFWNVYRIDFEGNETNIYPVNTEIGHSLWFLGDRSYSVNGGKIAMKVGGKIHIRDQNLNIREISTPGYQFFSHVTVNSKGEVFCIASGPSKPSTLLKITPKCGENENDILFAVREAISEEDLKEFDISEPVKLKFTSDGTDVHGFFYQPRNRDFAGPSDALPPVILYGHGGPTDCARPSLDLRKQFFSSRGFAVFDVDFRGSIGYGSHFRHLLKKQCGVYDRDDMINAAKMLIDTGRADPNKVAIMGSSACGFLILNCLVASDVFKSAVSLWGVADIASLSKITHKFERCYNEVLIGKYPEEADLYAERTPINHIDKITAAVAFLHGRQDTVVPVSQSLELYEHLKANGRTTALQVYENEGHGFRGAEAVRKSNEAAYFFLCKTMGIEPSLDSEIEIVNARPQFD